MAGKHRTRRTTPARGMRRLTIYVDQALANQLAKIAADHKQSITAAAESLLIAAVPGA